LLTLLLSGCGPCGLEGSSKVRRRVRCEMALTMIGEG
jgi:hypothetical protein